MRSHGVVGVFCSRRGILWGASCGAHKWRPLVKCRPLHAVCRWYKYGKRQRRAILAYAAFGTLGVIVLSVIIGAVVYGLQASNSGQSGLAAHRDFQVLLASGSTSSAKKSSHACSISSGSISQWLADLMQCHQVDISQRMHILHMVDVQIAADSSVPACQLAL